ncbi:MAG: TetR/AcrR family transcriptional regulator [Trueperaceae bacterium]|nr:TetR/AcrR family transcriptional regulator [Trueperaceae bacterium]MCC6311085.1 TetR/AcrR family transcriptional regulator [Trueperaceae bacterium]MCO5173458.1 TetR/AcrR family transcriptional regulator [Trueperaceae bacterium]
MSALPRPTTARGEATRGKLLAAAEAEFGENGFASTAVSDITRRAGVAQGTFYLYFPTKADALRQLVQDMGRQLRHALTEGTAGARDRLEVERLGLEAFIDFALEHQNLYKVVMESQFVDDSIYREYYQTLADSYTVNLQRAQARGELRTVDASAQAWALMGVAHFLGLRYAIWERSRPPRNVLDATFDLLAHGIAPGGERGA